MYNNMCIYIYICMYTPREAARAGTPGAAPGASRTARGRPATLIIVVIMIMITMMVIFRHTINSITIMIIDMIINY